MEQKQRLYIYDRKEMVILTFLGVLVAAFAFTLGVHLGKRVAHPTAAGLQVGEAKHAETTPDTVPSRHELQEQHKAAVAGVDETLNQSLHEEVVRTGIKLDSPRQIELPDDSKPKSVGDGSTATQKASPRKELAQIVFDDIAATRRNPPEGRFTLQVGSYNSLGDAKDQVDAMEALGLKPVLRAADIRGRGRWYRVYLGGYPSQAEAERAGTRYRGQHVIESYIVSKMID